MRKSVRRLSKSMFAILMSVALLAGSGVSVLAEETVSGNKLEEAFQDVKETADQGTNDESNRNEQIGKNGEKHQLGKEGVDPLETYNGIPTEWLTDEQEYTYSTEGAYLTQDAFAKTTNKKGVQGDYNGASYVGSYGGQHTLLNINVTDMMGDGSNGLDVRYDYGGYTYWFRDSKSTLIKNANAKGATISIVILVPFVNGKEILIDPTALANKGNNTKNAPYYAPNVRGAGRRYYEALFAWMAETWCREDCHVDNFILGNEVNMPNSWNFTGTTDPQYNADLYADAYLLLYNSIRAKTPASRVSVSVDHSWQHNDEGRGISAKDFINRFHASVASKQANVNWCISTHLYPAVLSQPDIWVGPAHMPDAPEIDLNPKSTGAMFVDGNNLSIMTNYIKNTFGAQHRIMLTEQGFSQYMGANIQAASLAYSYYAAKYDPMVDCFILNVQNEGGKMNFSIAGTLAGEIFGKIDNGNAADQTWIESVTLPTIGVKSYSQIVPNYGRTVNRTQVQEYVKRLYKLCFNREPDANGLADWTNRLCNGVASGSEAAKGFFFSDEFKMKNTSNAEYVELLYNVMMGRPSDAAGKADWMYKLENGVGREGVFKGFADSTEFNNICNSYGILRGETVVGEGRDKNPGLTTFVARLYTKALNRKYEVEGLNDWCNRIVSGSWSINDVSTIGFFNSDEFYNRRLSDSEYVKVLYRTFFDREFDKAGYNDWMNRLANGTSRNEVMLGFANSREFANLKKTYGL